MKVLLLSVNCEKMPSPVFPLGLAYIVRALREAGHSVQTLDLCFSQDVLRDLERVCVEFRPDVIGFSLRNLDNLTYPKSVSYLEGVEGVVRLCRRLSRAKLVMGGSGFSLAPRELVQFFDIDFGIVGEGEEAFVQLLESLERNLATSPLPHLLIKGSLFPPFVEGARVASISAPDRALFHTHRYLEEGGMLNLQTKRGCPFSCIYCTYPVLEGKCVRLRGIEEVVGEVFRLVHEQGIDYLYFVDDIFNYPPSFAEALCREMAKRRLDVKWSAFVNPGFITEDLLKWMKEAGCAGIEFGTDSGSPRMLRNYRKSFSVEQIIQASQLCSKVDINHCHYLLFGGPGEDEETIEESFQLMDQLDPTAIIAMLGIRIYPETELEQVALLQGMLQKGQNLIFPHFYLSPALKGKLEGIVREKALERRQWIVPGLEINVSQNLMEGIRRFGIRGPLWELVRKMKRPRVRPLGNR
jgi:radical SAM superfamily enzyme YgiQ (UPF0313 family)